MEDPAVSSARKRLLFRSRHRGTKELDLVLGPFAESHLDRFSATELDSFAAFLDEPDTAIYDWLTGRAELPVRLDNEVTRRLLRFARRDPRR